MGIGGEGTWRGGKPTIGKARTFRPAPCAHAAGFMVIGCAFIRAVEDDHVVVKRRGLSGTDQGRDYVREEIVAVGTLLLRRRRRRRRRRRHVPRAKAEVAVEDAAVGAPRGAVRTEARNVVPVGRSRPGSLTDRQACAAPKGKHADVAW